MNKYQESLNTIKSLLHDVCNCTAKNLPEMENNLQELVNKSTPKKAKELTIHKCYELGGVTIGNKEFYCPSCGTYQESYYTETIKPQYCSFCGQRLDLGGNE